MQTRKALEGSRQGAWWVKAMRTEERGEGVVRGSARPEAGDRADLLPLAGVCVAYSRPSGGAAGSPSAWGESGRRSWGDPRTPDASRSPSGPRGRRRCCFCNREQGFPSAAAGGQVQPQKPGREQLGAPRPGRPARATGAGRPRSRQLLQDALLVDLVGAVGDVGVEMLLGVLLQDVADVFHANLRLVPLLQGLEEPNGARAR